MNEVQEKNKILDSIIEDLHGETSPHRRAEQMNSPHRGSFYLRPSNIMVPARERLGPIVKCEDLDGSQGRASFASKRSSSSEEGHVSFKMR